MINVVNRVYTTTESRKITSVAYFNLCMVRRSRWIDHI